jgi:hypothetical protein
MTLNSAAHTEHRIADFPNASAGRQLIKYSLVSR